jgi:N-methylhydantoinase A
VDNGVTETAGGALGIDVGGTFVDFALLTPTGDLVTHKTLADPRNLAGSVLAGLTELAVVGGLSRDELLRHLRLIVHGTTVATNAVLTHTGTRTGLLTTAGTRDALEMRRGLKEEVLNNKYQGPPPLVPRFLRLPVVERIDAAGRKLTPLDPSSVRAALDTFAHEDVQAIAICTMHAYANDAHERAIADLAREALPGVYVTISSALLPQLGYYQRVSTTVLNSYVGPLLSSYILALADALRAAGFGGTLLITTSAGGVMSPEEISRRAAAALLSGPAAGPSAGRRYAQQRANCAVIDMGGTSLDMSLIGGGEPLTTTESTLGGYTLALPMVDIRTIGSGGGSIAWLDDAGLLRVGPKSAGALPGPAAYGRGGTHPTCTDADVVLGYIAPSRFLGGRMPLDRSAAEAAIQREIGDPLHLGVEEAAIAIFEVINADMATGIRDMIVDHGMDPRTLPLVVGGGAGPVHAGALAAELGMAQVIVPRVSGVFCATGMLFTDLKYDFVQSYYTSLDRLDVERWRVLFDDMERRGRAALRDGNLRDVRVDVTYAADLRYARQLHELTIPLNRDEISGVDPGRLHARFDRQHERSFGYALPDHPLELVNLRVTCIGRLPKPAFPPVEADAGGAPTPAGRRLAYVPRRQVFEQVPVYAGDRCGPGHTIDGPAIVELPETTLVVPSEFRVTCDRYGTFVLENLAPHSLPASRYQRVS